VATFTFTSIRDGSQFTRSAPRSNPGGVTTFTGIYTPTVVRYSRDWPPSILFPTKIRTGIGSTVVAKMWDPDAAQWVPIPAR
jgi:hypothetical protein